LKQQNLISFENIPPLLVDVAVHWGFKLF